MRVKVFQRDLNVVSSLCTSSLVAMYSELGQCPLYGDIASTVAEYPPSCE